MAPQRRMPPASQRTREDLAAATQASRFAHAQRRIKRIVDAWPPLSAEQREKLALILRPGGDDAPAA